MRWPCDDGSTVVGCLDLSPPDVVDGVPVRLDALGWACAVLASYGYRDAARELLAYDADPTRWWDVLRAVDHDVSSGRLALGAALGHAPGSQPSARAVVAEALRKGRPGVAS
jgi:hypothetical protein